MKPEPLLYSFILNNRPVILFVIIIVIIVLISILLREYFCWYWKINKTVDLLESIDKKLDVLPNRDEKNGISNKSMQFIETIGK